MDAATATSKMRADAMLRGVGAVASTSDPQVTALIDGDFHHFDQWKSGREVNRRSKLMRLRLTLDHLLSRLLGARDYAGAAQVLSVLYHRFTLIPSRCVQASLEILRRHPEHHKEELLQFYQAALRNGRLDQVMVFKEILMLHIVSGDYYDAYHLFKDEMQELDVHHDAHLQGTFGMVCYWLLFIESDELRSKFSPENSDSTISEDDEDDESSEWNPFARPRRKQLSRQQGRVASISASALVESRFMFKTPIGVHILYQEASTALRRAIAVSPQSSLFLEFYVQLLTLVGDTDRACDLLEHFYYIDPSNPHATRLLASYLEAHFPESEQVQVDIYARWLQNDPFSSEALTKLVAQSKDGAISHERLLAILANAIDAAGGDIHISLSAAPVVQLWRSFAESVQACVDEETRDTAVRNALESIRTSRKWWAKSYLSRPVTPSEVISYITQNESFHELVVLKAIVAYHLFKEEGLAIGRGLYAVGQTHPSALKPVHMKKFRCVFPVDLASELFAPTADLTMFKVDATKTNSTDLVIPVLTRSLLVKNTTHTTAPRVEVAHFDSEEAVVDQELVRALEEAVRIELADGRPSHRLGKRSFETMIGGLASNGENTVSVPLYVDLIEEMLYKRTKAWSQHMQVQLNGYLRDAHATIPSWLEVQETFQYFQERWISNEAHFEHPGLLLRYEAFLVRYMRKRAKSCQYWIAGVAPADVHDALKEMKLHVSRSHVHFPQFDEAFKWMSIKAPRFIRTRRRLLRDYMLAMRFVAYESDHVETRDLVYAAMRVAAQNYHSDLLAVEDLQRQAKIVLVNRYAFVVRHMRESYREFFEAYVRPDRVYNPAEVFAALKRRYVRVKQMTLDGVKAFLWLKRWEAENPGRYHELLEDRDDVEVDG